MDRQQAAKSTPVFQYKTPDPDQFGINVVTDFGADNTGQSNASPNIQDAINWALFSKENKRQGGTLFFPRGTYLLDGTPDNLRRAEDGKLNGIHIPYTGNPIEGEPISLNLVGEGRDTILKAGSDAMFIVRFSASHSSMSGFQIKGNATSVGLALAAHRVDVEVPDVQQNHNIFRDLFIYGCAEGVMLQCAMVHKSGCYYNSFHNLHVVFDQEGENGQRGRGVWFRGPHPSNRNSFSQCMFGRLNTGVQIENSDTNTFFGCSFEDIGIGENMGEADPLPNDPPTAILVCGGFANRNRFFGCTVEGADYPFRAIENGATEFFGCSMSLPEHAEQLRMNLVRELENQPFCIGGGGSDEIPIRIESALSYQHDNAMKHGQAVKVGTWLIREEEAIGGPTEGRLIFYNSVTRREFVIKGYVDHTPTDEQ